MFSITLLNPEFENTGLKWNLSVEVLSLRCRNVAYQQQYVLTIKSNILINSKSTYKYICYNWLSSLHYPNSSKTS